MATYVLYKGDEVVCVGTAAELAKRLGVMKSTIYHYSTPAYHRRVKGRMDGGKDAVRVVRVDERGDHD